MIDPDCHYGDHTWRGGGVCVRCGKTMRCEMCGQFLREDGIEAHFGGFSPACPVMFAWVQDERRAVEETFA